MVSVPDTHRKEPLENRGNRGAPGGQIFSMHPLKAERKPGPRGQGSPLEAEEDLMRASRVLDMVDRGELRTDNPGEQLPIPVDASGRPRRRLTPEDERELARRVQTFGDIDARNAMVMANLGLVHLVANQMRRPDLRYDDLVQEGTLGLLRATETFDPTRGVRFSTYCVYWIRAKIQRFLQRIDRDDIPSIAGAGMEENDKGQRKRPRARRLSLDGPTTNDEDRTLGDMIALPQPDPEDNTLRTERERRVDKVLKEIAAELNDPRLQVIIDRRLLSEEPHTLAELGQLLNLSREGARLLEAKILRLARQKLVALAA